MSDRPITCYRETIDGERRDYIQHAPDFAYIHPGLLAKENNCLSTITGSITITATNGVVVYDIVDVGLNGSLHCRKVSSTLTPYTPPHRCWPVPCPHRSDCNVHNEPALPRGACNCGAEDGK